MPDIFEIQPDWCRMPLPEKEFEWDEWQLEHPAYIEKWEKVLRFDPGEVYERIGNQLDPYKRIHSIPIGDIFPDFKNGLCGCGCGKKLEGRYKRWADHHCSSFSFAVRSIICNIHQIPSFYIGKYYGDECIECKTDANLQLDHIIPIKHGGGGSWLRNYQWLCHDCHVDKTNEDFGRNQKDRTQFKMDL